MDNRARVLLSILLVAIVRGGAIPRVYCVCGKEAERRNFLASDDGAAPIEIEVCRSSVVLFLLASQLDIQAAPPRGKALHSAGPRVYGDVKGRLYALEWLGLW